MGGSAAGVRSAAAAASASTGSGVPRVRSAAAAASARSIINTRLRGETETRSSNISVITRDGITAQSTALHKPAKPALTITAQSISLHNPLHFTITIHNSQSHFTIHNHARFVRRKAPSPVRLAHTVRSICSGSGFIRVPGPRAERAALGCVWGLGQAASETSEVGKPRRAALDYVGG